MPVITSIEPQKRKKDWFNVFVDNKFAFGLSARETARLSLKVNRSFGGEELKNLIIKGETEKLFEKTLNFLSFRPRSVREVQNYLRRKICKAKDVVKENEETITREIFDELSRSRYLDDEAFARWWVSQRSAHKPRGVLVLRQELRQKGAAREIIEKVLSEFSESQDDFGLAKKSADKKFSSYKGLPKQEFISKMGAYLARRGFSWDTAKRVIDSYFKEG